MMKGFVANFIWIIVGMFFFAMTWMFLNEVYTVTYDHATTVITEPTSLTTISYLDLIWTNWPFVILIGGYLMYMYSRSQKEGAG